MQDEKRPGTGLIVRSFVFNVWIYAFLFVVSVGFLPILLGPRRWALIPARTWIHGVVWGLRYIVGARVEVRGLEHRPVGPAIVASKHQGMFDIMEPFLALDGPCFVLKRELSKIPVFGLYCTRLRMIPVDRGGGSTAVKALVRESQERIDEGLQVLIFPEGTRRPPGAPPAYKIGVAALYRDLDMPVTPMATNSGQCWPANGFLRYPGLVVFEFLPPIPPGMKRANFMTALQEAIEPASTALLALNPHRPQSFDPGE